MNSVNRSQLISYLTGTQATQAMGRNYVLNPSGFLNAESITASGSATVARNTTTPLTSISDLALTLDNNATDTIYWTTATLDNEMSGGNCEFRMVYTASSIGSNVVAVVKQGSNIVAKSVALPTATTPQVVSVNAPCGDLSTATTVGIINDTGNTGTSAILIANLTYGRATNLSNVSQAEAIVQAYRVTSDQSISTTVATTVIFNGTTLDKYGEFDITTGIFTAKRAGIISAATGIRGNNLTAAQYLTLIIEKNGTGGVCSSETLVGSVVDFAAVSPCSIPVEIGDQLYVTVRNGTDNSYLVSAGIQSYFSLLYFPTSSQVALNSNTVNSAGQLQIAGATNCTWSLTDAAYASFVADSDCGTQTAIGSASAPGTKLAAAIFTNLPAGKYLVLAQGAFEASYSVSTTDCNFRLWDGTNQIGTADAFATSGATNNAVSTISGMVQYSSFQSSVTIEVQAMRVSGGGSCRIENSSTTKNFNISLIPVDQSLPAPLLVGSVTSNSTGLERIERAAINCSGSSSIGSQSGSWITGVSNIASGYCTLTLASGIFSSPPACVSTVVGANPSTTQFTIINNILSSTSINVGGTTQATGSTTIALWTGAIAFDILCMGPR